jgi:hypothetical protein
VYDDERAAFGPPFFVRELTFEPPFSFEDHRNNAACACSGLKGALIFLPPP